MFNSCPNTQLSGGVAPVSLEENDSTLCFNTCDIQLTLDNRHPIDIFNIHEKWKAISHIF